MPKASNPKEGLLDSWGRSNRKHASKNCPHCGSSFNPRHENSKYCSRPCMWANNGGHNRKDASWWKDQKGYIQGRVWVDGKKVAVKKHRWIMEQYLERTLEPDEDVHHINGIKDDNRIENLEVIKHGEHSTLHNLNRSYRSGYCLNISDEERQQRSLRAKKNKPWEAGLPKARAALAKARGE